MTTQRPEYSPTIRELLDAFDDEIRTAGGSVFDTHENEELLMARATLPIKAEIRLNDNVNGGVAIRAAGNQVEVYPYTFRQVCVNGAIVVEALQSQRFERIATDFVTSSYEASLALGGVRDAVRACA